MAGAVARIPIQMENTRGKRFSFFMKLQGRGWEADEI